MVKKKLYLYDVDIYWYKSNLHCMKDIFQVGMRNFMIHTTYPEFGQRIVMKNHVLAKSVGSQYGHQFNIAFRGWNLHSFLAKCILLNWFEISFTV